MDWTSIDLVHIVGDHDADTITQIRKVSEVAQAAALMPDGHLGYWMPIGGVAAFKDAIPPAGVGYDIACGNKAVRLDLRVGELAHEDYEDIGHNLFHRTLEFGMGGRNTHPEAPKDHPIFSDDRWDLLPPEHRENLRQKAISQLGTIGAGNHYVDVFEGSDGYVWVGCHFGSRGFGWQVAAGFMALSAGKTFGERVRESESGLLDLSASGGADYLELMQLAGDYAYAGRDWVCATAAQVIGAPILEEIHNHHNFAWREYHAGIGNVWVVRKGATPAFPGQRGFVGGSMGDTSVILRGYDGTNGRIQEEQEQNLFSTVHGAGRVMSRTQAKGKTHRKTGEVIREGAVSQAEMDSWLEEQFASPVIRFGGDLDESPQAYRRLSDVLCYLGDTIEIETVLTPRVVMMAPPERGRGRRR